MERPAEVTALAELDEVWERSQREPVLLFKHSTTCPISAAAHEEFLSFLKEGTEGFYPVLVGVIESRPVSEAIALRTGVRHESPQTLLIREGRAVWDASHQAITAERIGAALREHGVYG